MSERTIQDAIHALQITMEAAGNPKIATSMSAYLKDKFKCFGIKSPKRNEIQKEWFSMLKESRFDHFDLAFHLWDLEEREFQYIAVDYLNKIPKKAIKSSDFKELETLITTKSWWETVDGISSNYVGSYFLKFPEQKETVIERWRNSDNIWLNRTCLIFQLKYKEAVDFDLLKSLIIQLQNKNEFFIQKAIGWSLRQYSKYNPSAVSEFIHEISLEGLAKREASKYL